MYDNAWVYELKWSLIKQLLDYGGVLGTKEMLKHGLKTKQEE